MEHYIAVDNVCAWPNLTLMPNGDILASIFNQPCHGMWEGDVECWASSDGGRTWTLRGTPAPHEPSTNRMNVAAGLARDGSMIVLVSGWSNRNPVGQPTSPHEGKVLPVWVCRSLDNGATWTHEEAVTTPAEHPHPMIPFGDVIQLANGELGVSLYSWDPEKNENSSFFFVSSDDGKTWFCASPIRLGNTNETNLVVLNDGALLAAARTLDDHHLELFRSEDHGRSWAAPGPVTGASQHPSHLLQLRDGRILLAYGMRLKNPFFRGIGVRLSDDAGESWSDPAVLVQSNHLAEDQWPDSDGGYPATVETEDGTLVTAYYTSKNPQHMRYHMATVRWNPSEVF